jgi:hypothetical protein
LHAFFFAASLCLCPRFNMCFALGVAKGFMFPIPWFARFAFVHIGSEEDSWLVSSYIYSCFSWKNCLEDFRSTAYLQTCSRTLQQNPEWRSALPKKALRGHCSILFCLPKELTVLLFHFFFLFNLGRVLNAKPWRAMFSTVYTPICRLCYQCCCFRPHLGLFRLGLGFTVGRFRIYLGLGWFRA